MVSFQVYLSPSLKVEDGEGGIGGKLQWSILMRSSRIWANARSLIGF